MIVKPILATLILCASTTVVIPAITGCAELRDGLETVNKTAAHLALTGSVWTLDLSSLSGTESGWEKPAKEITLNLTAKRYNGVAGVNRYFGEVQFDTAARTIKFGGAGVTRMAGPGLQYETAYLKMLSAVTSYQINGNILTLLANEKPVAQFTCVKQAEK